jgi:hypothetical protein
MTMPGPRPRSTRQAFAPREFAIGRPARAGLPCLLWRWRYELLGLTGLVLLVSVIGVAITAVIMVLLAGAAAVVPPVRRTCVALAWCVITPHRVRRGCAQAWIHSRDGKIPVVLRTGRRPEGQRVLLWCRAGTSPEDFAWGRQLIAASCWASDVTVTRHERFSHVVILDVVRSAESRVPLRPRATPPLRAVPASPELPDEWTATQGDDTRAA